ncbi:hypothetical protein SDRG_03034 [Saprolegnia diclina VS20]|uniref:Uncharacterized protein n=1 Tax=Saprolegnia diclina (strain VS20) TaxID=1156394 RepID=T0QY46_SAPDV|nr:hypothetical protein SDRG_03034 [Saprolegnia diclina VS20]EQC39601.1 hypothetical protein SDRG_03034 [Saprolegnia diclina VS20]|eukprot:XP_008606873.1 hypothetical protein SDRG_03034 [Saprolegnia diclina VS20]
MAPTTSPTRKGRRGSATEDLVAWHGMSVKNFTAMVASGLPSSLRRRAFWMDVISTELKTRSKAKMSQGFISFVASASTGGPTAVPTQAMVAPMAINPDASVLSGRRLRQERPSTLLDDKHMVELVSELKDSKFVLIDTTLAPFVLAMSSILLPELHARSDLIKVLTFILHREQLPHNDRCILPYGDTTPIVFDTFESVLQTLNAKVHAKLVGWRLPRVECFTTLLLLPLSPSFPAQLRLRVMDHILVNGCVGLVSIVMAYLHRHTERIAACVTSDDFQSLCDEPTETWLPLAQTDEFWKECADSHKSHFLHLYAQHAIQMRAKHMTFRSDSSAAKYLHEQRPSLQFAFRHYDWVGFNVDHTLAEFKTEHVLKTSFERAYTKIQAAFLNLKTNGAPGWQPHLAHRGLAIDTVRGNFLFFGSNGDILSGYHGSREIPMHQLNWQYPLPRRTETDWMIIHTVPEMIFPQLFAWLIDIYEHGAITDEEIGYVRPQDEVLHEMEFILPRSAYSVLSAIAFDAATAYYEADFLPTLLATPEALLRYNANIRTTLEHISSNAKKRMFLLTNSSWEHTNAVLQYSIGKDWVHFFDIIVTKSVPSVFFDAFNTHRFMEVPILHGGSKTLLPLTSPMLERGHVYAGGNITEFMLTLGPKAKVCYIGDHLLHDIVLPAENVIAPWATVAIIGESSLLFRYLDKGHVTAEQVQRFMWSVLFGTPKRVEARCRPTGPFFYLDVGGVYSQWGKKINDTSILCVDSISRLHEQHDTMSVDLLVQARLNRRRDSVRTRASATTTTTMGPTTATSTNTTLEKLAHLWHPNKVTGLASLSTNQRSENPGATDRRHSMYS